MPKFTPTQTRIIELLKDGKPHHRLEVLACVTDDTTEMHKLHLALVGLRKRLRPVGHDVLCELVHRRINYRLVRLVNAE